MLLSFVFYLNSLGNFALQIGLGALLSPAEYGRYATVSLAALTLAAATLDWLKVSALRFSVRSQSDDGAGVSLELGYFAIVAALYLMAAIAYVLHWSLGLTPALLLLMTLLAVASNRVDFVGARFRAHGRDREFSLLYGLRQGLYFTVVVGVAYFAREATAVIAAMAFASFACAALVGRSLKAPLPAVNRETRRDLRKLFFYGQPLVVSLMLYQLIYLVNRSFALHALGAAPAGNLSLATDIGSRLFVAFNALPELMLFQIVLKQQREHGTDAAIRQLEINAALVFALLAGLAAGYMAMAKTFAALVAPLAYRKDFADLSLALTPGFLALCLMISAVNPAFQLVKRTLPIAVAGATALVVDLALLKFTEAGQSLVGLAKANSVSFAVGFAVAVALAARISPARPRWRDLALTAALALLMGLALRRLDALSSHLLAAALALTLGGAFYLGGLLALNVADIRTVLGKAIKSRASPEQAPVDQSVFVSEGVVAADERPRCDGENVEVE
jgi:O-antigen/teichoic acid export membrane protein